MHKMRDVPEKEENEKGHEAKDNSGVRLNSIK